MYEIVTDESSNLGIADQRDHLTILPFTFAINGESITADTKLDDETVRALYARMRKKQQVTTSQINLTVFTEAFERAARQGHDVLYIGISSGVSGTYHQGELAAAELRERYPDRQFLTIDSRNAGYAVGMLVLRAVANREKGMSLADNAADITATVPHMRGVFIVDDINHLHRTGRVSGVVALAGALLGIKPLLKGDDTGHIVITAKARGKRAALDQLARELGEHIEPDGQQVLISHCDAEADAYYLAERVKQYPSVADVRIGWHEPMTGSHLGPGAVALFYLADQR